MRTALAGVLAAVAVLLGAASYASAGDEEALFGKKYHSVSVTKDGNPYELVEGTRLLVQFHRDDERTSVAWRAGCNFWGARFLLAGDVIDVKPRTMAKTDIACPARNRRQDEFFARFFRQDPSWAASGDKLTLATERVAIELRRR